MRYRCYTCVPAPPKNTSCAAQTRRYSTAEQLRIWCNSCPHYKLCLFEGYKNPQEPLGCRSQGAREPHCTLYFQTCNFQRCGTAGEASYHSLSYFSALVSLEPKNPNQGLLPSPSLHCTSHLCMLHIRKDSPLIYLPEVPNLPRSDPCFASEARNKFRESVHYSASQLPSTR